MDFVKKLDTLNMNDGRIEKDRMDIERSQLTEYRLTKLEEAVAKLSQLSDIVLRWDTRLQQSGGIFQCNIHAARMDEFDKKISEIIKAMGDLTKVSIDRTKQVLMVEEQAVEIANMKKDISELKKFMYKAAGAFIVISIVIQLFGPVLVGKILGDFQKVPQKIEIVLPSSIATNTVIRPIP